MEFFDNHKKLFRTALVLFVGLTIIVAIMPAINNQENNAPLPGYEPLTQEAYLGKKSFIANGCVACHTQQVRNVDMDNVWGSRPGIPADYAGISRIDFWTNTATLMGTERTGPDLTNIGLRQPSLAWNLLHIYQPGRIVATQEALQLVAYLQSLKQTPLPDGKLPMEFLYKKKEIPVIVNGNNANLPDGKLLYTNNCMSCHQANGEGLKGAFPSLKGSPIVLGNDLELFVNIIMLGYDARPEYAVMNAVGLDNNLTPEEVTAIINHEKTSWGNNAKTVTPEEVKKIMDFIKLTSNK
ncbi:MAG: cbb3-type cytochrome c oxidase subunit II [Bacteroidetes bacterium]|nr:cbb3-type cytochrome c oxidase subunit II [Bacteroidota bacterium]